MAGVLLCSILALRAQSISTQPPSEQDLQQLADAQRWQDIVHLLEPLTSRSANLDFYLGIALAHLGRFPDAQNALGAGHRLAPGDPRFPIELAGIAFKQKNYPETKRRLRQALRLEPNDSYANDFLGTVYFLEDNLEAALKYWNRAGKPQIDDVREDPTPRVSPVLLDHAFAFSPAATLTLPQFLDSNARLRGMGIFQPFHFDLNARSDGNFDVVFRARERNGLGNGKLESLFLLFQGLPFQEVNPQYYNWRGEAINFNSMYPLGRAKAAHLRRAVRPLRAQRQIPLAICR